MKRQIALYLIFAFISTFSLYAQIDTLVVPDKHDVLSIGPGVGLEYGGIGSNLTFYPHRNIGVFGGLGFALVGFGYNIGTKFRFTSESVFKKYTFFLTGMYGYNAGIKISDGSQYDKLFYGPSFGLGFDYKKSPERRGYWTMSLLLPIRSSEVQEYIDDLKDHHGVEMKSGMIPIAISIGYRYIIK